MRKYYLSGRSLLSIPSAVPVFSLLVAFFLCLSLPKALAEQASSEYLDKVHKQIKAHHYQEAMILLKVKADKGCAYSQSLLGLMHQKGLGCKSDPKEAAHWFSLAARHDFVDAQFQLGKLYKTASRELAPEADQARYWLTRAADQGVSQARQLIDHVPGGEQLEYKVAQFKNQARADAGQREQGLVQAWTGYSNIVNTLNSSASNATGNN